MYEHAVREREVREAIRAQGVSLPPLPPEAVEPVRRFPRLRRLFKRAA